MKLLSVVGARPQFVKAAAVCRAIATRPDIDEVLVHTGQHFSPDMSAVFFTELEIAQPKYSLDIHGGSHGEMTGRMLAALEQVMLDESPDGVLVYGDTNSTLAAALAAAKLHIPIAHVEAGLRSFNRTMPEEVNRVLTDHVSALLLCPTQAAVTNLANEGIRKGVQHVGDVMFDAALHAAARDAGAEALLERLGLEAGAYSVATIHRAENTDDGARLAAVFEYLRDQANQQALVLPLHPRTRGALEREGVCTDPIAICSPLGYVDMTQLVRNANQVFTDSGGLQKEAYFHGVPCVTLRDETEWVETVELGWNRLWRAEDQTYAKRLPISDYGNGTAAEQVVESISQLK